MATTVEIPFELDMIDPTNANFYWTNINGPLWYQSVYRFEKVNLPASPSGDGISTWKINIPKNIAGTPAWNVVLHHSNSSGAAGRVLLRGEAVVLGSGDTPAAMTTIVPNQLIGVDASGDRNVTVLTGTNFDSLVPLTAGEDLHLRLIRIPKNSSGDSLTKGWDLNLAPILRVDVA